MKLIKAMATVGGLTFLSRILGFIRDTLTAIIMGAGPLADAFFVALKLPNLFRRISAEGAFSVAFIPLFSESIEKDGKEASLAMSRNMMGFMVLILCAFVGLGLAAMPFIIRAIAPGFEVGGERYATAWALSCITFPYLLFISMAALLGGVMNSVGRFGVYAFLPSLFNVCLIGVLVFNDIISNTPAEALAIGVLIAGIVQFLWIFIYAGRHGWLVYPTWPRLTPKAKKLFILMLPGILGAGVYHLNIFADMIIASFLEAGSISYLYYADRLQQLPLGVVGIAVGTALLPMLSRSLVAKNHDQANQYFNRSIEACLFFALPAAVALMLAAKPIIASLFNYGEFTSYDTRITSMVLTCYALGLPFYIVAKVFQSACFAHQDTKTPVKISMICAVTNIIFGVILSQYIGVAGIALATSLSGIIQIALLYRVMKRMDHLSFDRQLKVNIVKIISASLVMACVLIGYLYCVGKIVFMDQTPMRIVYLSGLVGAGGITYAIMIAILKVFTKDDLKAFFKKS
jgi:putative peptidoglycan lipid II flippase